MKFSVFDTNNNSNHLLAQRIIPLKCLRQGYRHVRLRNSQNQTLELASLFIQTHQQYEHVMHTPSSLRHMNSGNQSSNDLAAASSNQYSKVQTKHKQFKVTIYSGNSINHEEEENDSGIQVKVTQDTTVQQVIEQV